jgi:hypothetical protein
VTVYCVQISASGIRGRFGDEEIDALRSRVSVIGGSILALQFASTIDRCWLATARCIVIRRVYAGWLAVPRSIIQIAAIAGATRCRSYCEHGAT